MLLLVTPTFLRATAHAFINFPLQCMKRVAKKLQFHLHFGRIFDIFLKGFRYSLCNTAERTSAPKSHLKSIYERLKKLLT